MPFFNKTNSTLSKVLHSNWRLPTEEGGWLWCSPPSYLPGGCLQGDHRCPPRSHLASAQSLLLVSLNRGEALWNLQSTFLNTEGELWGSANMEASVHRGSSAYRVCGPTGLAQVQSDLLAQGQSKLAACPVQPTTQAPAAPQTWAHPHTHQPFQSALSFLGGFLQFPVPPPNPLTRVSGFTSG